MNEWMNGTKNILIRRDTYMQGCRSDVRRSQSCESFQWLGCGNSPLRNKPTPPPAGDVSFDFHSADWSVLYFRGLSYGTWSVFTNYLSLSLHFMWSTCHFFQKNSGMLASPQGGEVQIISIAECLKTQLSLLSWVIYEGHFYCCKESNIQNVSFKSRSRIFTKAFKLKI